MRRDRRRPFSLRKESTMSQPIRVDNAIHVLPPRPSATIGILLIGALGLGACATETDSATATGELVSSGATDDGADLVASITLDGGHRVDFLEPAPGMIVIAEVLEAGAKPRVTQKPGTSLADVYRSLRPGADVPPALLAAEARAATAPPLTTLEAPPPRDPQAAVAPTTVGEQQWFWATFCNNSYWRCVQGPSWVWTQTPRPAASFDVIGMAGTEAYWPSAFTTYWWDCRSGSCYWSALQTYQLNAGYYVTLRAWFNTCPQSAYFGASLGGTTSALYSLAMTYANWIDC
jgi:hypothetical protein